MRTLISIVITLLLAAVFSHFLKITVNPEVKFWKEVIEKRQVEITSIRQTTPASPIIFFTGGSSCAFSINPEIIETHCQLPTVNMGLPAACGPAYLIQQALDHTRKGDLLIVCMEPDLLTDPAAAHSPTAASYTMAAASGQASTAAGTDISGEPMALRDYLTYARPSAGYLSTLSARVILQKSYRYTPRDIRYRGHLITAVNDKNLKPVTGGTLTSLSATGRLLLENLALKAQKKGIKIAYSLPWQYTQSASLQITRENRSLIIKDISTILPVLHDDFLGSVDQPQTFADSTLHLTAQGANARTSSLISPLKSLISSPN